MRGAAVVLNSIPMLLWIGAVVAASWLAPRRTQGSVVALLTGLFLAAMAYFHFRLREASARWLVADGAPPS